MSEREEQLAAQDVEARDEVRMGDHLACGECSPGCESCRPACGCVHDSPDFVSDAQKALEARGFERLNRHGDSSPRDWPEDRAHENGDYECRCAVCGESFIGHKRRVTCRVCWVGDLLPAPALAAEAKGELSREAFKAELDRRWYMGNSDIGGERLKGTVMAYVDRLRTRAREAEERAERLASEHATLTKSAAFWGRAAAHATTRANTIEEKCDEERARADVAIEALNDADRMIGIERENAKKRQAKMEAALDEEATARGKAVADLAAIKEAMEGLDLEETEAVWAKVEAACQKAWDKPQSYNDSPAELIAKIIDERDEARELAVEARRIADEAREQRDALLPVATANGDGIVRVISDLVDKRDTERAARAAAEAERDAAYRDIASLRDISLCRLQFPDGTVPGGTEECARGWHQWYRAADERAESLRARLAAAEAEVKRLREAATASPSEATAKLVATFRDGAAGMGRSGWAGATVGEGVRAVDALEAEVAALRERCRRLEEAARPILSTRWMDARVPDSAGMRIDNSDEQMMRPKEFTLGDLRRLRAALDAPAAGGGGKA